MTQMPKSRQATAARNASRNSPRVTVMSTEHHNLNRPSPSDPAQGSSQPKVLPPTLPSPEQKAKPIEEVNSTYVTIGLPSQFQFYDFKSLSIRPLKAQDQAKLYQACMKNSLRTTVEAISATLGNGVSALSLTPQDFYFLMYWQRTNSFLKTPHVVTGYCNDVEHNQKVTVGYVDAEGVAKKLDEKTLKLHVTVTKTTLETKDYAPPEPAVDISDLAHLNLGVETMADVVWAAENMAELENIEQLEWLAGFATFLKPEGPEDTLLRRCKIIEELSTDQIAVFNNYIRSVTDYGVSESTVIKCQECGASNEVVIPIDAHTFFPNLQRG